MECRTIDYLYIDRQCILPDYVNRGFVLLCRSEVKPRPIWNITDTIASNVSTDTKI
jgi:hypothetical protein